MLGWILVGFTCLTHVLNTCQRVYGLCGMVRWPWWGPRPLRLLSWCRRVALPSAGARLCLSYSLLLFRSNPLILSRYRRGLYGA